MTELGCRFGDILQLVKDEDNVSGVDVERSAIKFCAENVGIQPVFADLNQSLPFESETFDVVTISEVLEHLPYPSATIKKISRILIKGGKVVGSVPNGQRLRNRIRFLFEGVVDPD